MYGESVFTTMRMINGSLQDWELHYDRFRRGVEFLYGPFTEEGDWSHLLKSRLEQKFADLSGDKIVRVTAYREQARGLLRTGLYSISEIRIHLSQNPLDRSRYEEKMIKLRTCPVNKRPHWWPPYLKAGNYLDTILSQKRYMHPGDDDVLFLSEEDTVLESSVANIFIVRHNKLFTAPLGPNVLEGIMRKKLISVALDYFDDFEEAPTNFEQLMKADAIIGTNSVRGVFLVDRIDDHEIFYKEDFLIKFQRLRDKIFT
jgi:4-amino-4-deoxychorismate lyase